LDLGRQVSGLSRVGEAAKPIDDKYPVGTIIRTNDVFYMMERGPAKLTASSTSNTLTQHSNVSAAALGVMAAAPAVADTDIIGKIDTAVISGQPSASAIVWIREGISGGEGGTA
jgi:hypothetical protein